MQKLSRFDGGNLPVRGGGLNKMYKMALEWARVMFGSWSKSANKDYTDKYVGTFLGKDPEPWMA